jgi:hypothetical protein
LKKKLVPVSRATSVAPPQPLNLDKLIDKATYPPSPVDRARESTVAHQPNLYQSVLNVSPNKNVAERIMFAKAYWEDDEYGNASPLYTIHAEAFNAMVADGVERENPLDDPSENLADLIKAVADGEIPNFLEENRQLFWIAIRNSLAYNASIEEYANALGVAPQTAQIGSDEARMRTNPFIRRDNVLLGIDSRTSVTILG